MNDVTPTTHHIHHTSCITQHIIEGAWINDAKTWYNGSADAPALYYEWQARSQVSTWWPVPPSSRANPELFAALPVLDNYANKHWNG